MRAYARERSNNAGRSGRAGDLLEGTNAAVRLRPDVRRFAERWDRYGTCRKCGTRIVVLPDDRRQGYCFDCYDSLEVTSAAA